MSEARKPMLEVRGFTFGNEAFPRKQVKTINQAITFVTAQFELHRGLVCFIESGDRVDDATFVPHDGGVCLRISASPRTRLAAAQQVA